MVLEVQEGSILMKHKLLGDHNQFLTLSIKCNELYMIKDKMSLAKASLYQRGYTLASFDKITVEVIGKVGNKDSDLTKIIIDIVKTSKLRSGVARGEIEVVYK